MLKKINQCMPMLCLLSLIMCFLTIMINLFYRQVLMPRETRAIPNEIIYEIEKIDLNARYPYTEEVKDKHKIGFYEKIIDWTENIKNKIMPHTSTVLPYYEEVFSCYRKYNNIIGWNYNIVSGFNDRAGLKLDNGYLSFVNEKVDEDKLNNIAIKLKRFSNFLAGDGINFYYINGGYKVLEEEKHVPSYNEKFENADYNAKILMRHLRNQGINVLDIREEAKKENKDWYSLFYRYDHHMKTEAQLWVAGKIAKLLTEKEGYTFSENLFSLSEYSLEKKNILFGSQARGILKNGLLVSPEEYTKIIPKFDTYFEIELPVKGIMRKGNYEDSLFKSALYKDVVESIQSPNYYYSNTPDAYSCLTWGLDALGIIKNKIPNFNKGKKVLILQDSFGSYPSTYLAQGLDELHLVYLPVFNGSIRTYIKDTKPDVVLMLYTSSVANKFEASKDGGSFDLD